MVYLSAWLQQNAGLRPILCLALQTQKSFEGFTQAPIRFFYSPPKAGFFLWSIREKGPYDNSACNCVGYYYLWHTQPLQGRLWRGLYNFPFSALLLRLVCSQETPQEFERNRQRSRLLNSGIAASTLLTPPGINVMQAWYTWWNTNSANGLPPAPWMSCLEQPWESLITWRRYYSLIENIF